MKLFLKFYTVAPRDDTDQLRMSDNKKPMGRNARMTGTQNGREKCPTELSTGNVWGLGIDLPVSGGEMFERNCPGGGNVETPMQDYQSTYSGYDLWQSR